MVISYLDVFFRMGAAAGLGGAIGYERQRSGRPTGVRTHLIVSVAAATFMLVSTQFVYFQTYTKDDLMVTDPSRIAASVVAGVGFLGAGVLLRTGLGVQGITTAASLWLTAATGLAAGGGMYVVAVGSTVLTLFALVVLRRLKGRSPDQVRRVTVALRDDGTARRAVIERLSAAGVKATDEHYDMDVARRRSRLTLDVRVQKTSELDKLVGLLAAMPEVKRVKVKAPET